MLFFKEKKISKGGGTGAFLAVFHWNKTRLEL